MCMARQAAAQLGSGSVSRFWILRLVERPDPWSREPRSALTCAPFTSAADHLYDRMPTTPTIQSDHLAEERLQVVGFDWNPLVAFDRNTQGEALEILGFQACTFADGESEFDAVFTSPEGRFNSEPQIHILLPLQVYQCLYLLEF